MQAVIYDLTPQTNRIYKTIVRPILLYSLESWIVDKNTEMSVNILEIKYPEKYMTPLGMKGFGKANITW